MTRDAKDHNFTRMRSMAGSSAAWAFLSIVHVRYGLVPALGLAKFVAFRDLALRDYVYGKRNRTTGGTTQIQIARLLRRDWLAATETEPPVRDHPRDDKTVQRVCDAVNRGIDARAAAGRHVV